MERKLKKRKSEALYEWAQRLAKHIADNRLSEKDISDILHEVSVHSYLKGIDDERELQEKYGKH